MGNIQIKEPTRDSYGLEFDTNTISNPVVQGALEAIPWLIPYSSPVKAVGLGYRAYKYGLPVVRGLASTGIGALLNKATGQDVYTGLVSDGIASLIPTGSFNSSTIKYGLSKIAQQTGSNILADEFENSDALANIVKSFDKKQ